MAETYERRQTFKFNIIRRAAAPSALPRHRCNFNFFFEIRLSRWYFRLISPREYSGWWLEFMGQDGPSKINTSFSVIFQQTLSLDVLREGVERAVASLRLSHDARRELIELAWKEACQALGTAPLRRYTVLDFDFCLRVVNHRTFGIEKLLQSSVWLPAADPSLRSSERVRRS